MIEQAGSALTIMLVFSMGLGINFRGAMSIGKFFESDSMIIGHAIDETTMDFEKSNWVGVHITPSIWSHIKKNPENYLSSYIEYEVPTHNKPIKTFVLVLMQTTEGISPDHKVKSMVEFMHKHLEESSEPEGFEKWKNTIEFMYYCKKNIK